MLVDGFRPHIENDWCKDRTVPVITDASVDEYGCSIGIGSMTLVNVPKDMEGRLDSLLQVCGVREPRFNYVIG